MSATVRLREPVLRSVTQRSTDDWRTAWTESFGARWYVDLSAMAIVVFFFGAVRPLADPDLPMHLAVGEWIARHGSVPLIEPFAWTRAGAPYYAYSWLQQTAYYELLRVLGPWGLRAYQGLLVLASAVAVLILGRAARWRPSQAVIIAAFNLIVGSFFVGYLRPQAILLITIPLIWAGVYELGRGERIAAAGWLIFAASAATSNSHLFFPLTLTPLALLWVHPPRQPRAWLIGGLSVVVGWMTSPYALHWPDVFRHNFGANILTNPPSIVTELQPGFVAMLYPKPTPMIAVVAAMLALPWVLGRTKLRTRERLLAAAYWGLGLVLFGYATRLFVVWWLLSLPTIGWAIVHLTRSSAEGQPRLRIRVLGLLACLLIIATELVKTRDLRAMEGDTERRTLPTHATYPAERLASSLERRGFAGGPGRMMSTFILGSYLTWRLPHFSQSIDSRGIFPDSVAAAETLRFAWDGEGPLGPWRSADLVLVPLSYRVAAVLDSATGWRRIETAPSSPGARDSVGLWARLDWWTLRSMAAPRSR